MRTGETGLSAISLKVFGGLVVEGEGIKVEIGPDRSITAYSSGLVKTTPLGREGGIGLEIGAMMPDGTVYAGVSPDTGKEMYAMSSDARLTSTFDDAAKYASRLDAYGYRDWRLPTLAELNMLFQNREDIGGFDTSGSRPGGWYWSSSHPSSDDLAWTLRFRDGLEYVAYVGSRSALRCVRG